MLSRRRLLGITAAGVATMGVASVTTARRYDSLSPDPTPTSIALPADTTSHTWQEQSRWTLPGEINCLLPQRDGRALVGGEESTASGTTGYLASLGPEGERELQRVSTDSQRDDRIADISRTQRGLVALQTAGSASHRLLRLAAGGKIQSATALQTRDTKMFFPRLIEADSRFRLAGLSAARSAWDDGVVTVQVIPDGTPQWNRTYGYGIEPSLIQGSATTLVASVTGYSESGLTTGLLNCDKSGLRYHRQLPGRDIYDLHLVTESDGEAIVIGETTDEQASQRGFESLG
jgi:hypothetical protein